MNFYELKECYPNSVEIGLVDNGYSYSYWNKDNSYEILFVWDNFSFNPLRWEM